MKQRPNELFLGEVDLFAGAEEDNWGYHRLKAFLRARCGKALAEPNANPEVVVRLTYYDKVLHTYRVDVMAKTVKRYNAKPLGFLCETKVLEWVEKLIHDFYNGGEEK